MANVLSRIEQSSDRLVGYAFRLQRIIADERVEGGEVLDLHALVHEIQTEALRVEDVALDIQEVRQILHLGRENCPNRHLRDRRRRVEKLLSFHLERKLQRKAVPNITQNGQRKQVQSKD